MAVCTICPRRCNLSEGQTGFCRTRKCEAGIVRPIGYGKITSMALDPIEKKPLYHFYPNSKILSVGSFGCNLRCPFCQNHQISMAGIENIPFKEISPQELASMALALKNTPQGNLGVAFTYNEPLIGFEFVYDTAKLLKENGLKVVLVTNGFVNQAPLEKLLPFVDAMNIDLKGFTQEYYDYVGGKLDDVLQTIKTAYRVCHIELTTLVVPGKNDNEDKIEAQAEWIASLSDQIPLHLSRYFPCYQSTIPATPIEKVHALCQLAGKYLKHVYAGNCR